jgi:flagellar hook assembly protein FlgD
MQDRRQRLSSNYSQSRKLSQESRSPNLALTALTVGAVILLLAVTFVADWMRTPDISVQNPPTFFSPNHDNSFDSATIIYQLSEEAEVSAKVISEGGTLVRGLLEAQKQPAGQHFLVWDGMDASGSQVEDGRYRIEISAKGSLQARSTSISILVDTQPPSLQLINLPDGERVRDADLVVEGITEPGSSVWIGSASQAVAVDGSGHFRTLQKLNEGDNTITVRAADEAGNSVTVSRMVDLVTAAPQIVITSPAEGAWIGNSLVTVEGQAPGGVTLKINNQSVPVAPDGSFRFDLVLDEGDQRIQLTATDDVGNVTTVERIVRIKTHGPALKLNIEDGASVSDSRLQLTGTTSTGATVKVNQKEVAVGALGDFQTTIQLFEGPNSIQVDAQDQAGNVTTVKRQVRYEIPKEPTGVERLMRNLSELPNITIPAILLVSISLGFFLYRQNQLSMQLTVDRQDFTPGLPQEGKNLTLWLDLTHPARVTLEVVNQTGQVQARLLDNRRRSARQHVFLWDGYDDFGRPVDPGVYTIRAVAGAPPIKVTSAVQVKVEEDPYVVSKAGQFEKIQLTPAAPLLSTAQRRSRIRQNRKRI